MYNGLSVELLLQWESQLLLAELLVSWHLQVMAVTDNKEIMGELDLSGQIVSEFETQSLMQDLRHIIEQARGHVAAAANYEQTMMYWRAYQSRRTWKSTCGVW